MTRRGVAAIAVVASLCAPLAGCGGAKRSPVRHALLSQVRRTFGDTILRSAFVEGSVVTVTVALPHDLSDIRAGFEAQMLASAVHDSVRARGGTPITSVKVLDVTGAPVGDALPVRDHTALRRIHAAKCQAVAEDVSASSPQATNLSIRSVTHVPYAGGGCAFTFQTAFPAALDPRVVVQLDREMSNRDRHPILVEVDNSAGLPFFVQSWTPAGGTHEATGGHATGVPVAATLPRASVAGR